MRFPRKMRISQISSFISQTSQIPQLFILHCGGPIANLSFNYSSCDQLSEIIKDLRCPSAPDAGKGETSPKRGKKKDDNRSIHHSSQFIIRRSSSATVPIANDKKSLSHKIDSSARRNFFVDVKCVGKKLRARRNAISRLDVDAPKLLAPHSFRLNGDTESKRREGRIEIQGNLSKGDCSFSQCYWLRHGRASC